MNSSKAKVIIIVVAVLLFVGFVSVGCKQKSRNSWVNTDSMPGNTFVKHNKKSQSQIVYLGAEERKHESNFGPRDVSFEFVDLR